MPIDEERLLAWVDGALDPTAAAEVAAAVAADPELAALAASHRAVAGRLRGGFDTLLHEPVPAALAAAARPAATVTDLAAARSARDSVRDKRLAAPARRFRMPQWAAIAATLAVGIIAGRMTGELGPQPIVTPSSAGLQASGALAAALDGQLASAPDNAAVRVQVTFRSRAGEVCRSWSATGQAGVACHAGDRWRIMASLATPAADTGEYRMAGSSDPRLLGIIDGMIDGEPFDATRELQARRSGWR